MVRVLPGTLKLNYIKLKNANNYKENKCGTNLKTDILTDASRREVLLLKLIYLL